MSSLNFRIENPLNLLEQSGLLGITINDNAAPASNVVYSSLKTAAVPSYLSAEAFNSTVTQNNPILYNTTLVFGTDISLVSGTGNFTLAVGTYQVTFNFNGQSPAGFGTYIQPELNGTPLSTLFAANNAGQFNALGGQFFLAVTTAGSILTFVQTSGGGPQTTSINSYVGIMKVSPLTS